MANFLAASIIALGAVAALAAPARAAILDSQPHGFDVSEEVAIAAPPAKVWKDFAAIGKWWSPSHTYSHDARNLTLTAKTGGCFCERLPNGGGVEHLRVVHVAPGAEIVLAGALGPLKTTGANGYLRLRFVEDAGATKVTLDYVVGGFAKGGMETWSAPVDGVLSEQLSRLKRYSETGKPD